MEESDGEGGRGKGEGRRGKGEGEIRGSGISVDLQMRGGFHGHEIFLSYIYPSLVASFEMLACMQLL